MPNILEISKRATRGGRVPIKIALLKIHDDTSETNDNGIHWKEEYVNNAIDSLKMMPICAEFFTEDKEVPLGHGLTGNEPNEKGLDEPIFENSEAVGVIENGSIEDVEINGKSIKALCGNGYLYNQRYPRFTKWVRKNHAIGNVDTSIEIMGLETNANKIVYEEDSPTQSFRTPKEFSFSGTAILSVTPGDKNAIVLEVAQKQNKEEKQMDEKTMRDLIVSTITETNSENSKLNAKIEELNSTIADKDAQIADLNEKVEANVTADADKDAKIEELNGKVAELEAKLDECKKAEQNSALNKALEAFTEDEQKYAESEINAFRENPIAGNVDTVVNAIHAGIGKASKEAETKTNEQNSANNETELDIFSEINSVEDAEDDDVNIF